MLLQPAPQFELQDQNGQLQKLSNYLGKWVLLYFYPKDDTPGCTIEACSLRDNLPRFGQISAIVLGISSDSVESHKAFAEKHGLPFILLADPKKQVIEAYKVGGGYMDGAKRMSFLINPKGEIVKIYENVNPELHAEEVLENLKTLNQ